GERLTAALAGLEAQLQLDGERVAERLRILGRDATLKRLYLVREGGSTELADFVEERRRMLGLDFLNVTDANGATVVDAAGPDTALVPAVRANVPILYEGAPVGAVNGGVRLDLPYLRRLKQTTGVELALLDSLGRPIAATLDHLSGAMGPTAEGVRRVQLDGR